MKTVGETTWQQVFDGWREREAHNPAWIKCATETKGWPDWESWRSFMASQFGAAERAWRLAEFTDPMHEIPAMLVGPFSGWQSRLTSKNTASFDEYATMTEGQSFLETHDGIAKILAGMPFATEFIGLARADGKIVCIEGHHRAAEIALAKSQGKTIDFPPGSMRIALADLGADDTGLLDAMLARGSAKTPPA